MWDVVSDTYFLGFYCVDCPTVKQEKKLREQKLWHYKTVFHKSRFVLFPDCLEYYLLQMENLLMVFYFLSQEKVSLCSCPARERVAKCTLQTHQCEAIYLSDRRTKKHSGCFHYFFFLCYCLSLEWGTNHCNLLLFLLFFHLYSSFCRSLSVLWKSPKINKPKTWQWNKTMCGRVHAQENKMMIAVVNLIWQFLIPKYMTSRL